MFQLQLRTVWKVSKAKGMFGAGSPTPWRPGRLCAPVLLGCGISCACAPSAHPDASQPARMSASGEPSAPTRLPPPLPSPALVGALEPASPSRRSTSPQVQFSLLASARSPAPDATFWVGAQFLPPPGSHIYWKNPGESGLATRVELSASGAVEINSPLRYPGPTRFVGEGKTISYGYDRQVTLLAAARMLEGGPAVIEASASWLSCREVCVRETAQVRLDLRTAASSDVAEALARLPVPVGPSATTLTSQRPTVTRLRFSPAPGWTLHEFFPDAPLGPEDRDCSNAPELDGSLSVELQYERPPTGPMTGVVRATREGTEQYFEVAVPAPR